MDFNLYLITDRKLLTVHSSLLATVEEALKGGLKALQLREKDLGTRELLELAYKMRELTGRYNAKLFINDRLDIALCVNADGVHLGQNSIPPDAVRKAVKRKLLIGVSTHSLKEAKDAEKAGADFITFGPVYKTPSKLKYGLPVGIEALREVCKKIRLPVFAIGGVNINRVSELRQAGAYGVALISALLCAGDIREMTRKFMSSWEMNK
ncbi:MAG TPA: thiamine phosphate synthase [Nitrospiraceae bacterium]|nr:thiamine phosphate synthase [Nitrospiraceae bacterium]